MAENSCPYPVDTVEGGRNLEPEITFKGLTLVDLLLPDRGLKVPRTPQMVHPTGEQVLKICA